MRVVLLAFMVFNLCGAALAEENVLARRIQADAPGAAVVWLPDAIGSGMFAWRIAESAGVPLMFQASPMHYRDPATVTQRVDLAGLTVRETLDILVAHDPRYAWEERDGVIIIRPSALESNPDDTLNQPIAGFHGDQLRLEDVLSGVVRGVVGGGASQGVDNPIDSHQFALDVTNGSVLDVLVAAARAHGEVMWSVPDATHGRDKTGFSLGFQTFAGRRAGAASSAPGR